MQLKNKVGLGTFPLASVFEEISKEKAKKIIETFFKNGGFYIDTAPLYGFGEVEILLGEILNGYPRDKYCLITKCGKVGIEKKNPTESSKYEDVIRECEKSLRRLKIDYIDLYQIHSPDPNTPFSETMEALIKLQNEGKIKEIGVSNVNLEELKEYNRGGKIKSIENRFSLINRSIGKEFEKYLLENKISLIPYQVIERGQLTDKILEGVELREKDLRRTKPEWQAERLQVIVDWVKKELKPIAQEINIPIENLAISWTLSQKFIDFTIVGVTNVRQLLINMKSSEIVLSDNILKEIDRAYSKLEQEIRYKYEKEIHEFRGLNEKYY